MQNHKKYFPGRVIFDHLEKTGGQAINAWLASVLGSGSVTPNLIGEHQNLISQYGGQYSIISSHISFNGTGLDLRYQYLTLLREPVDRIFSWLYFLIENHSDSDLPKLRPAALEFLETDGESYTELRGVSNVYVEHFCRINGRGDESDDIKLANALAAVKQYDVVGLYHEMPKFLADVATLIGLPAPVQIPRVNVTKERPGVEHISVKLMEKITALNELDLQFFDEVKAWKASLETGLPNQSPPLTESKWAIFESIESRLNRVFTTPDIHIHNAFLREGSVIQSGSLITFDVDFTINILVQNFEVGIHIFDENRRWAFGINSSLLDQSHSILNCGLYRASYYLLAELPVGKYTAGFAFSDRVEKGSSKELAWYDALCEFEVIHPADRLSVGYSNLPATIGIRKISESASFIFKADDPRIRTQVGSRDGSYISTTGNSGYLIYGPYLSLAAGNYCVVIRGMLADGEDPAALMDIVRNEGQIVVGQTCVFETGMDGQIIAYPFSLEQSCSDLEIRVLVNEGSRMSISTVEIKFISSN